MYIRVVNIISVLILCTLSFAAPPAAPQFDSRSEHPTVISKRDSPPSQGHVTLSTNPTGSPLVLPWGIRCYTPDFARSLITYDTCLPLLDFMSTEDDFRESKPYRTRNPVIFKVTPRCQLTGWPGPARDDSISNQYIAAMAVWYVPLPFLLRCATMWRGLYSDPLPSQNTSLCTQLNLNTPIGYSRSASPHKIGGHTDMVMGAKLKFPRTCYLW